MTAAESRERAVNVFDQVSVDGAPGIAAGFYARREPVVVVRLKGAG